MNINNKELINILLWADIKANSLVNMLSAAWILSKRHGKMLYTKAYINEVKKVDKDLWYLLSLLKKVNKTTQKEIKNLIVVIKNNIDSYHKEFTISASTKNNSITEYLNDKFKDSKVETKVQEDLGINISWEWWYFKKDLDLDLQKLLW